MFLTRLEMDLMSFLSNEKSDRYVCPPIDCNYHRLLVHRIAETCCLGHPLENTAEGKTIVLLKTDECRQPEYAFWRVCFFVFVDLCYLF